MVSSPRGENARVKVGPTNLPPSDPRPPQQPRDKSRLGPVQFIIHPSTSTLYTSHALFRLTEHSIERGPLSVPRLAP